MSESCIIALVAESDRQCASGSAVEHHLAKVGVAGSIPVSRSEESPFGLRCAVLVIFVAGYAQGNTLFIMRTIVR